MANNECKGGCQGQAWTEHAQSPPSIARAQEAVCRLTLLNLACTWPTVALVTWRHCILCLVYLAGNCSLVIRALAAQTGGPW